MSYSRGLKFRKFDLHTHTTASDDFIDKQAQPADIVKEAISQGLRGIAITDHLTGASVDAIKAAAHGTELIVFPGTEIKVNGGKEGIHLIALFDVDKDTAHVTAFLNSLGVYDRAVQPSIADQTVIQVAKALQDFDPIAILTLAHCLSGSGAIGDMRGDQRNEIFKPEWHCLLGVECGEDDFKNPQKIKDHDRIIDLLDGGFDRFYKKKMGVYQASDAHKLADVGSKFTYFKVDDEVTIEDIRQSLIDRDTRIRQSFEYRESIYPRIDYLKATGGFLDEQEIKFHEGLNSLLGAKGSGKSLAVEFLRFGLNHDPKIQEILADHNSKLEKCLKIHGSVEIGLTDESGKQFVVTRTYNPAEGNPIRIIDAVDGSLKTFDVSQVFPVLFLSQNEIVKIAEDPTGGNQRRFIDRFFDFYRYQEDIHRLDTSLEEVDKSFADILRARSASRDLGRRIATAKAEIEKLDRQLNNVTFEKYAKKERIGKAIQVHLGYVDSLKQNLDAASLQFKDLLAPSDPDVDSDPAVKRAADIVKAATELVPNDLLKISTDLDQKKVAIQKEYEEWENNFAPIKAEYEQVVKDSGGTQIVLDQSRKKLLQNLAQLEKDFAMYQGKIKKAEGVAKKRNEIIDNLEAAYTSYFEERKTRCQYFTEHSVGALSVTIKEKEDKSNFRENLMRLKRGSWLKDDEIQSVSEKISPREFIDSVLRYDWSMRQSKMLEAISEETGIKLENIEKLVQHLLDEYDFETFLALLYTSVPDDVPTIAYKVGDDFKVLSDLSVGQKAVALLIIALSDGSFPIVIDQPEDSLDLRTIWDDVCQKLRGSKDKRQFILTTHNSSVAVASDTDKFTILQAGSNQGKIIFSGSINRKDIKDEVINYLEGGRDTYIQKKHKYNI